MPGLGQIASHRDMLVTSRHTLASYYRIRVIPIPATLKPVENGVLLVQGTQSTPQVVMNWVGLNRLGLHVDIPYLS